MAIDHRSSPQAPSRDGLTAAEVEDRRRRGLTNAVSSGTTRTVSEIVRANTITRFNLLLGALFVVTIFVAPIQDALFGIVLVANTLIGIVQELRAKRTLDQLALLNAPRATVVRDGRAQDIPVEEVVRDDVLALAPGDQVVVDGPVLAASGLEVNESLLTGESDPVVKAVGDELLSGSFVVAGSGRYVAAKVGPDAYAARLAAEARRFTLVTSELRRGVDLILAGISWAIPPTIALLVWSQLRLEGGVKEALRSSVAGAVGMVPQGLVLLLSIAFAVGVVRLGRRQTLVQELPAIEILARVDVVCFDKTGTLTEGRLSVEDLVSLNGSGTPVQEAAAALAAADPTPNATLRALGEAFPTVEGWASRNAIPFSSDRRWSGAEFGDRGTWVLGAPEVIARDPEIRARAEEISAQGRRVLAIATTSEPLTPGAPPADCRPQALLVLGDRVREEVADTLEYFASQDVAAKVISGDNATTVASIARRVGMRDAERAVDGTSLPDDEDALADMVERNAVFGRIDPQQKRAMVRALQRRGHVVAMTGDGVNDVLALKDADIGVAMGSGSTASRSVAQVVLLDGSFASLPAVVAEGRRVIANIERVANLFVTKTVYALILALAIGLAARPFPFVPRHLTLVGSLTIGIPAFWLALAPTAQRAASGFIWRVMRFALPVGAVAATATLAAYELALFEGVPLVVARTTATLALAAVGMYALVLVSRPLTPGRKVLIAAMVLGLFAVFAVSDIRTFFELELPGVTMFLATIGIISITGAGLFMALKAIGWAQYVPDLLRELPDQRWWRRLFNRSER